MASSITNRIVGTVVLLALAALIVPELLKEPQAPTPEKFEVIPLRPELGEAPKPATYPADALATTQEVPKAEPLPDDNPKAAEPTETEKPQTVAAKKTIDSNAQEPGVTVPAPAQPKVQGVAYVVQLGAFGNHQSALDLVEKLRNSGFKAFLVQENGLSKVMVGPDADRSRLEGQLAKLNAASGLKGRIFQYDPLQ